MINPSIAYIGNTDLIRSAGDIFGIYFTNLDFPLDANVYFSFDHMRQSCKVDYPTPDFRKRDAVLIESSGMSFLKQLRDLKSFASNVIVVSNRTDDAWQEHESTTQTNFYGSVKWVRGPRISRDLEAVCSNLMQSHALERKIDVAIYGLGKYGKAVLDMLRDVPYVRNIHAFSQSSREVMGSEAEFSYEDIISSLHLFDREGLHFKKDFEHWKWAALSSDIVLVSTGVHNIDYKAGDRNKASSLRRFEKENTLRIRPVLEKIAEALSDYNGITVCTSTQIEANMAFLEQKGLEPSRLCCPTPDEARAIKVLKEKLGKYGRVSHVPIYGSHSSPLIDLVNADYEAENVCREEVFEWAGDIEAKVRKMGKDTMVGAENCGALYRAAPEAFASLLEHISRRTRAPSMSLKSGQGYMQRPARISSSGTILPMGNIPKHISQKYDDQLAKQKNFYSTLIAA